MRKIARWMIVVWGPNLLVGVLAIFTFCGAVRAAPVVTANLNITPSPTVKPGDLLKFQAIISHNPAFDQTPGTKIRVWVTRHDFSWVSEKLDIEYPGMGSVTVNFTKGFAIPSDAKSGQVFDFYLVWGIWYPMSDKASVKVMVFKRKLKVREKMKIKPELKEKGQ